MSSRWNMLWAIPWMIVTWGLVEVLVFFPLYLVGLIVFPLAWRYAPLAWEESRCWKYTSIIGFKNAWLNEWLGNHGDGLLTVYWDEQGKTAYSWFIRNPISNMRFWPLVSIRPIKDYAIWSLPLRYCGNVTEIVETPGWFVAWYRGRVGLRWIWSNPFLGTKGLAIGWHLNPRDRNGIPGDDVRRFGIGTVCQRLSAGEVKA